MATKKNPRRLDPERSSAVVEALGGVVAVARAFGLSHPSVSNWKRFGIPEDRLQSIQVTYKKLPAVQATLDFHPWVNRA